MAKVPSRSYCRTEAPFVPLALELPSPTQRKVSKRHCDLMALFEVFMVYGEDRDNPGVQHKFVAADDMKQAELKSGLVADPAWVFDYVMMFNRPICEVNVKEKPSEVANVEKKRKTT